MLVSIFRSCYSRPRIVLIGLSTKRFTTSISPMQAGEYYGEFSRMVSSVLAWYTVILNAEIACSLSVLTTTLSLPQNSNPLQRR